MRSAAALFAVHPLRVESVAWVAGRKDVLSGLFFVFTMGAYASYVQHPFSVVRYLAIMVFCAMGLMAKPMVVTLPRYYYCWTTGRWVGSRVIYAAGKSLPVTLGGLFPAAQASGNPYLGGLRCPGGW